ncbi:hypothetical protein [Candidatus Mycoplasma haematohominis]|uniref:hypothetical protein n=1 Tax=Candidatus Mycoplasma haematohominis TaxID=1494318 RepID=UPI001C0A7161|nr:hypothetical protein [Candidatus Mycoplasma haemohominis]
MDPLKVGAATAAVAVGATGAGFGISSYLNTPYSLYSFLNSNDGKDLKESYKDKLGGIEKNQHLFVADTKKNEWWWKAKYQKLKNEEDKSDEFKNATDYDSQTANNTNAINKLCDAAYKKDSSGFTTETTTTNNKTTYKKDIAKYC